MNKDKKIVLIAFIILAIVAGILIGSVIFHTEASAMNKTLFDMKYQFNYAYVIVPGLDTIEGEVKSWADWDDSDMLQVTFKDGTTYYSHASNIILCSKK